MTQQLADEKERWQKIDNDLAALQDKLLIASDKLDKEAIRTSALQA